MTRKILFSSLLSALLFSSCVSSKVYKDLQGKYADLQQENEGLSEDLQNTRKKAEQDLAALQAEYDAVISERNQPYLPKIRISQSSSRAIQTTFLTTEAVPYRTTGIFQQKGLLP